MPSIAIGVWESISDSHFTDSKLCVGSLLHVEKRKLHVEKRKLHVEKRRHYLWRDQDMPVGPDGAGVAPGRRIIRGAFVPGDAGRHRPRVQAG
jgi:hypothetical protein